MTHRHGHGEDDDEHDEVEGSGVPPGDVPHLLALGFRTCDSRQTRGMCVYGEFNSCRMIIASVMRGLMPTNKTPIADEVYIKS